MQENFDTVLDPDSLFNFNFKNETLEFRVAELTAHEQIVANLRRADRQNIWQKIGFKSLRDYCEKELNYSPLQTREILIQLGHVMTRERMTSDDPDIQARILKLIAWRRLTALQSGIAAFRVLTNRTLMALAEQHPRSLPELHQVKGLGEVKIATYGAALLSHLSSD